MSIIRLSNGNTRHIDDPTKARARAASRLAKGRALVLKHCTPPRVPDFSKCASVPETEWVRLGGDVEVYRRLVSDDEEAATIALSSLEESLTGTVSLTTRSRTDEDRQTSIDDEVRYLLVSLGLDPELADCSTESDAREIYDRNRSRKR